MFCALVTPPVLELVNLILPPLLKKYLASLAVANVTVRVHWLCVLHDPVLDITPVAVSPAIVANDNTDRPAPMLNLLSIDCSAMVS